MPKFNPSTRTSDEQLAKQAKDFVSGESSVLDRVALAELVRTHLDEWYSPGKKPEMPGEIQLGMHELMRWKEGHDRGERVADDILEQLRAFGKWRAAFTREERLDSKKVQLMLNAVHDYDDAGGCDAQRAEVMAFITSNYGKVLGVSDNEWERWGLATRMTQDIVNLPGWLRDGRFPTKDES